MTLLDYQSYFDFNNKNGTDPGFLHILDFLNTPKSGSAQNSAGITFRTFATSVLISLIYCFFQVCIFSLLRCEYRNIYQPNCYFIEDADKIPPLHKNFFSWVPAAVLSPIKDYKILGLDTYFFVRYLCFLLTLFFGLALLNLPVLIPVNYYSGYDFYTFDDLLNYTNGTIPKTTMGLDRISMSNIAPLYSKRMSIHLTMTIISILWFHGLLIAELMSYVKIKNEYLLEKTEIDAATPTSRSIGNTLFIDNVPPHLLTRKELSKIFTKIPGCKIKNIWFVYDYKDLKTFHKQNVKFLDQIEVIETKLIVAKFFELENEAISGSANYKHNKTLFKLISLRDCKFSFMYGIIPRAFIKNRRLQLQETIEEFKNNKAILEQKKTLLKAKEKAPLKDQKYNKAFIQFEDNYAHHLLNQIQISDKMNELDGTMICINPKDIIWSNLSIQSNMQVFVRVLIGNTLGVIVILGWVIPVAFIGLVSQLPYLTVLVPFLSWLNYLPDYITDVVSNFCSVILLVCLSELVPYIFRWLAYVKCKKTGAQVELDVQNWMFIFSFIHIFMVVTISSGLTVIVEGLLNNPVSIPNILARNLPKCSNFFFSYLIIRGFSYFGNNLLQSARLFMNFFIYPLIDITPRRKFSRLSNIPSYHWGAIYPTFAVLGSIGLIYCILSPLILVFCCISFGLILFSFKYSTKYQFCHNNASENYGSFYPRALFQLYSGIYFMEICLIGIFVLSKDEAKTSNCLSHAFVTFVLLLLTAASQFQIKKMFTKLLSRNLPLTSYDPLKASSDESTIAPSYKEQEDTANETLFNGTFHQECFQTRKEVIWIPKDEHGISDLEIQYLNSENIPCCNSACNLSNEGEIILESCPPDYDFK